MEETRASKMIARRSDKAKGKMKDEIKGSRGFCRTECFCANPGVGKLCCLYFFVAILNPKLYMLMG